MSLRLKVGFNHISHLQQYETLVTILSQAFGGGKGKPQAQNQLAPKTQAEAQNMFKSLFN